MTRVNRSRAVRSDINRHFNRNKSQGANADNGELPIKDVQKYQLRNGLTILLREDHSVPIVSTMICYRVGSRFESPGVSGISHFLEHMMFKGTKKIWERGELTTLQRAEAVATTLLPLTIIRLIISHLHLIDGRRPWR